MEDIDKVFNRLVRRGKEWAEKDAAASLLEETRKSVRAECVQLILGDVSVSRAEIMAEASTIYKDHIKAMVEARKLSNIAQVNYKAAQVWIDLLRSQESTRRAEMGMK